MTLVKRKMGRKFGETPVTGKLTALLRRNAVEAREPASPLGPLVWGDRLSKGP